MILHVVERPLADLQRPRLHLAVGQEPEASDPAVGRDVLVLLADRLLQDVDLDLARLLGQLAGVDQVLLRVQRLEQGRGEAARRSQPGARRDVGHAGDLQPEILPAHQPQRLADQRVLDVLDPLHLLHLRILQEDSRHEPMMDQDVDIFINGRGDEEAAVLLVVGRQVGPPAAERDPERATGHDHKRFSPIRRFKSCHLPHKAGLRDCQRFRSGLPSEQFD